MYYLDLFMLRYSILFFLFVSVFNYITFFFFNDTATTEIYTLSLHDALPISQQLLLHEGYDPAYGARPLRRTIQRLIQDRKSTRLNSSHSSISYAVFCLKKKKKKKKITYILHTT